ncbi:MAG: hypothetical protein AAF378_09030 [Cyanobacteria bacterium P01_A01_bin.84]
MKSWWMKCGMLKAFLTRRISIIKSLISVLLILSLSGCSSKAASQDIISFSQNLQPTKTFSDKLSKQISETSPPEVIQELRRISDTYQPQVRIVSPHTDEVLQGNDVKVRFDVKDLPIFKDSKLGLGSHLNVILDNDSLQSVYDVNQSLELSDLSPGTHTLRVFATRAWNESFKNEGAYAQTTFHIFTKSEDNNPVSTLPLLTYSSPQGDYGAEPILLDFYLTNAPLHLLSQDSGNEIGDWRIRCTINGESFILDRWQSLYMKGFKTGSNWIKLEFIDGQGNTIKNVFNSTLKTINYQPKGKDALSKVVRGELSAEQVRSIVDPNYSTTSVIEPIVEPEVKSNSELEPIVTPTVEPELEPKLEPKLEPEPRIIEKVTPILKTPDTLENNLQEEKVKKEKIQKEELQEEIPQKSEINESSGGFLKRFQRQKENKPPSQDTVKVEPTPNVSPIPEIIKTPVSKEESETETKSSTKPIPEELEQPETNSIEEIPPTTIKLTPKLKSEEVTPEEVQKSESKNQSKLPNLGKYFQPRNSDTENPDTKSSNTKEEEEFVPSPVNLISPVPEVETKEELIQPTEK